MRRLAFPQFGGRAALRWWILALRTALGTVFVAAGIGKLMSQAEFFSALAMYRVFPDDVAYFLSFALPWSEMAIGSLLVTGLFPRLVTGTSISLIIVFVAVNGVSIMGAKQGACLCFGELEIVSMTHWQALFVDLVMLAMALALWVCMARNRRAPLRP